MSNYEQAIDRINNRTEQAEITLGRYTDLDVAEVTSKLHDMVVSTSIGGK